MKSKSLILFMWILFLPLWLIGQDRMFLNENFIDNRAEWATGESDDYLLSLENGRYIFEHKNEEGNWYTWNYSNLDLNSNFTIEGQMGRLAGIIDHGYGLLWNYVDASNFYYFYISPNGYFRFGEKTDGEWNPKIDWTESSLINQNEGINVLTIQRSGDISEFFINSQSVGRAVFGNVSSDKIGLIVNNDMRIGVDYIIVKEGTAGTGSKITKLDKDEEDKLAVAIADGNMGSVQYYFDLMGLDPDYRYQGFTPLMIAVTYNQTPVVEYLLNKGADIDAKSTNEGFTALMFAAVEGHRNMIDLLISHEAFTLTQNNKGLTAEDEARNHGHNEIAEILSQQGLMDAFKALSGEEGALENAQEMLDAATDQLQQKKDE